MSLSPSPSTRSTWLLALMLAVSHLASALIQFRPFLCQHLLTGLAGDAAAAFVFLPGLIVLAFLLSLWRKREAVLARCDYWQHEFGSGPTAILLLGLLLPQRCMDANSGFVQIFPDSPLYALMSALDLFRTGCVFHLFLRILVPEDREPGNNPAEESGIGFLQGVSPWKMALAVFLVGGAVQFLILGDMPHVQDEVAQHWQATVFATGHPSAPPLPVRESFLAWGVVDNGVHLFSPFQPGLALLVKILLPTGLEGLLNPLLGALAILLFAWLLKSHDGNDDSGAIVFLALSPFFLLMSSGRMNHSWALVLFLIQLIGWKKLPVAPGWGGVLSGLAGGLLLMTRRVDALITVLAILIQTVKSAISWRRKGTYLLIYGVLLSGLFLLQTRINRAHSGDALQMLRQVERVVETLPEASTASLLQNLFDQLGGFTLFAGGGIVPGFLAAGFLLPLLTGSAASLGAILATHLLLTILLYGLYDYQDFCYGPRFWFALLPAFAFATFRLCRLLETRIRPERLRFWLALAGGFALLVFVNQVWSSLGNRFWNLSPEFQRELTARFQTPTLVLLKSATRKRLELVRLLKSLGADTELMTRVVSRDSLDCSGLEIALSEQPPPFGSLHQLAIDRFLAAANQAGPADFDIVETEIIRLNGPNPLEQKIAVAADLGDEPNRRLLQVFPRHQVILASRQGDRFRFEPYRECGIERFR